MDVFQARLGLFIVLTFLFHELGFNYRLVLLLVGGHGFFLHDSIGLRKNSMMHNPIFVDLPTFEAVTEKIIPGNAFEVVFYKD